MAEVDGSHQSGGHVLVVDDQVPLADTFGLQLEQWYDVSVAYGGHEALEQLDDGVDVVLLDRRMPDMSGDEVLEEIRAQDLDVQVVVVTAVDADFDLLSMDCDGYVEKPISGERLHETVERQLRLMDADERVAEFFAIADKLAALRAQKPTWMLEEDERYRELVDRQERLEEELGDLEFLDDLDEWT
jgi:DNA-binding response OmpR family regulator